MSYNIYDKPNDSLIKIADSFGMSENKVTYWHGTNAEWLYQDKTVISDGCFVVLIDRKKSYVYDKDGDRLIELTVDIPTNLVLNDGNKLLDNDGNYLYPETNNSNIYDDNGLNLNQQLLNQFSGMRLGFDGDGNGGYYKGDGTFNPFRKTLKNLSMRNLSRSYKNSSPSVYNPSRSDIIKSENGFKLTRIEMNGEYSTVNWSSSLDISIRVEYKTTDKYAANGKKTEIIYRGPGASGNIEVLNTKTYNDVTSVMLYIFGYPTSTSSPLEVSANLKTMNFEIDGYDELAFETGTYMTIK